MPSIKKLFFAFATLSGTIIGVGFFSLPYILSRVGLFVILSYFFILTPLVILIHLLFGKLAILTPDLKRFPGFVKYHLGKKGEIIAFLSSIFGFYGTLLAYLIIGGNFLAKFFEGDPFFFTLFYFLFGAIFIFSGIKAISKIEFLDSFLFLVILVFVFLLGTSSFNFETLFIQPEKENLFLPYGPLLFALWGASIIPEVEEMLGEEKDKLKKVIFFSILICALFYLLFAILICGICQKETSPDALSGLEKVLGKKILKLFYLFGVFTTFTSFISLGLTLKKTFLYDLKIKKITSFLLTVFPPLFFFLLGFKQYIKAISLVGAITLGTNGILILLMYKKVNPKSKFIYPLMAIFLVGIFYEIIYSF